MKVVLYAWLRQQRCVTDSKSETQRISLQLALCQRLLCGERGRQTLDSAAKSC